MISDLQALVLSEDAEGDLRAGYAARIATASASKRETGHENGGRLRILLAGYSGACNTGADLLTGEIVRQLRGELGADRVELGVLVVGTCSLPDWGDITLERLGGGYPPDAVHDLCARYDAVVVCEGSLFTSTFSDSLAMLLAAFLGMAVALGKPAVAYGAEADRMSPGIEEFVRTHAAGALLIARNAPSQRRLIDLGLAAELGTDTGWSFRPGPDATAEKTLRTRGWNGVDGLIVICPTNPFRWPLVTDPARALLASLTGEADPDHYQGMLYFQPAEIAERRCAAFLDDIGAAVRAHMKQCDKSLHPVIIGMETNDRLACRGLADRLGAAEPLIAGDIDPDTIVAILRSARLLISARYHAVLLSMAASVPAVGLAYDQRVPALLAEAGHPELALAVETPDLAVALKQHLDRLAEGDTVGKAFARFATRQRGVQAAMGRRVAAYLTGSPA